jgi:hypothetical protein
VVQSWIVESFAVRDQSAEDGTDFQQLMPIMVVTSQAGSIKAEDQPDARQANLGEQSLEAAPCLRLCS